MDTRRGVLTGWNGLGIVGFRLSCSERADSGRAMTALMLVSLSTRSVRGGVPQWVC